MNKRVCGAGAALLVMVLVGCLCSDAAAQPPGGPGRISLEERDADGDGKLSKTEFQGHEEFFNRLDADKDGFVNKAELEAAREAMRARRGGEPNARPAADTPFFQSAPQPKDQAEKQILDVLKEMDSSGRRMQRRPRTDGRFLRVLPNPIKCAARGRIGRHPTGFRRYGSVWPCVRPAGNSHPSEIDPARAELAKANFEKAGVSGLVTLVLGDAHAEVTKLEGTIDLLFLDADKQGYIDYLNKLLPLLRPGGLLVAHNITPGMADSPVCIGEITKQSGTREPPGESPGRRHQP